MELNSTESELSRYQLEHSQIKSKYCQYFETSQPIISLTEYQNQQLIKFSPNKFSYQNIKFSLI